MLSTPFPHAYPIKSTSSWYFPPESTLSPPDSHLKGRRSQFFRGLVRVVFGRWWSTRFTWPFVQAPKSQIRQNPRQFWWFLMNLGRKSKKCRLWKIKNKDFQKCVHLHLPPMLYLENNMSQHCVLPQPYLNLLWDFAPQAQWGPSNDLKWSWQAGFMAQPTPSWFLISHCWCRKIIGVGSIPAVLDNVCSIAACICICICIHMQHM